MLDLANDIRRVLPVDERKCRVIEMRFFGGLTVEGRPKRSAGRPTPCNGIGGWRSCGWCASSRIPSPELTAHFDARRFTSSAQSITTFSRPGPSSSGLGLIMTNRPSGARS